MQVLTYPNSATNFESFEESKAAVMFGPDLPTDLPPPASHLTRSKSSAQHLDDWEEIESQISSPIASPGWELQPWEAHVYLALFGMIGCMCRILLKESNQFLGMAPGTALYTTLPANLVGSLILGALMEGPGTHPHTASMPLFPPEWTWLQLNPPLQRGLRAGFCGSLTSWSSWNHTPRLG